jgi:signal transduction histidine kinase
VLVASVPLDGATALLAFASDQTEFPREDEQLLINVGINQGAIALQGARLLAAHERAEQALRESHKLLEDESRTVETLRTVGLVLTAELDFVALLQRVTDAATTLTGAQFGAFFYTEINEQDDNLRLPVISGITRERFNTLLAPLDTSVFRPTLHDQAVIRFADITCEPGYAEFADAGPPSHPAPVRSYLAQPVTARGGEVLGGLIFGHADVGVFGEREERLAAGIGAYAAIAIENARLYEAEREARAEAEAAVHTRDEFLAIASHELRTPLAGLTAAVQLMARQRSRGSVDAARFDRLLGHIDGSAKRLSTLLDDLLDVSRLRTGQLQLRAQPTDLSALLHESVEAFRQQTPDRDIVLVTTIKDDLVVVDAERIQQVIGNLLSNAIKYSPAGTPVHVDLGATDDGGILLRVQDGGIGLPAGASDTIFEPFGRAANAHAHNIPGMGLGLYICRQIVQSHGGRIWSDSPGDGQGTTFGVWLPRATGHISQA